MALSTPNPDERQCPVFDGERYVIAEASSSWRSARIVVRDEDISRSRSWKDVTANHTIIVNLGGLMRHLSVSSMAACTFLIQQLLATCRSFRRGAASQGRSVALRSGMQSGKCRPSD